MNPVEGIFCKEHDNATYQNESGKAVTAPRDESAEPVQLLGQRCFHTVVNLCGHKDLAVFCRIPHLLHSEKSMPFPMTFVPRMTWLVGNVASLSKSSADELLWHTGSPVSVDSSTFSETASSSSPSAGTSAPVSSRTRSPTTISRLATFVVLPFLMTSTASSSLT